MQILDGSPEKGGGAEGPSSPRSPRGAPLALGSQAMEESVSMRCASGVGYDPSLFFCFCFCFVFSFSSCY